MAKIHVAIAYDFDSDGSDQDAWEKFKDKYRPLLWGQEEKYPKFTAVLVVDAETFENAIRIVKTKIEEWISEIEADDTTINISKFFVACCNDEGFYEEL